MAMITVGKESNLWEDICADFAIKRAQAEIGAISTSFLHVEKKVETNDQVSPVVKEIFDPMKHSPVFCNYFYSKTTIDDPTQIEFDPRISHPACISYSLTPASELRKSSSTSQTNIRRKLPSDKLGKDLETIEYLEEKVYPILLKGIEKLLIEAEQKKCLERKRSAFNALDFLTRFLYFKNPQRPEHSELEQSLAEENEKLEDIPFVQEHFQQFPRPPLPLSLVWTEEHAAVIIQSFYRGYRVRKQPEVQELRVWQREWREANRNIHEVVDEFWRSHTSPMPNVERKENV